MKINIGFQLLVQTAYSEEQWAIGRSNKILLIVYSFVAVCISLKRLIAITLSCKLKSVASVSVQDGCDIHAAEEQDSIFAFMFNLNFIVLFFIFVCIRMVHLSKILPDFGYSAFVIYCLINNTTYRSHQDMVVHPWFQLDSCYSIFSFKCNVLQIVVCLFSFGIVLSVVFDLRILITSLWYLRFTDSDYLPLVSQIYGF